MQIILYLKPNIQKKKTLSSILHENYGISKSALSRMKFDGSKLYFNEQPMRLSSLIEEPGILRMTVPDEQSSVWPVCGLLDIVYEDEALLVINKPAKKVMHPCHGHYFDALACNISAYLKGSKVCSLGRLDEDTSGLLVYAKHALSASMLENRPFSKNYLALVHGVIEQDSFWIDTPIRACQNSLNRFEVHPLGKPCRSHVRVVERLEHASLVALQLETGRSHQIRVHMESIGHPLFGDPFYGMPDGFGRTALHVCRLEGVHPISLQPLHLSCAMPADMKKLYESLRP
jgi:23S rRNA pseudouridine1911/1915/1917 synthase